MIFNYAESCWTKGDEQKFYNDQHSPNWNTGGKSLLKIVLLIVAILFIIFLVPRLFSKASVPMAGSPAPDFTLPSQEGAPVSLRDYRGKWIVLYFYPKDQTPGCTREAHNFQADQSKYDARQAVILGVSVDSVDSHKKFCAKEGLNFKLLADRGGNVSKEYGSLINLGLAKMSSRHTFLIDPSGTIAKTYTNVDPIRHSEEVLAALDQLKR
jgi:peroxiredoxin Q/BCP